MAHERDEGSAESRLIARYFKPLATHRGAFGLEDDAAAITPPPGRDMVLNADGLIAGVHFFPDDPAEGVGRKALRVNLSDLAAKGARPLGFLLSIALPRDIPEDWIAAFAAGLGEDAEAYQCPLLGGDTDATPGPISISIAAFGTLPLGTMVRRSGATPGDRVFVTGTIGDAALGLKVRQDAGIANVWGLDAAMSDHLVARYRLPQPRVALAELVRTNATASMDVSDGLAGDLAKLCRASGVSADIDVTRVPLSRAGARALGSDPGLMETILSGGEDYEILGTLPSDWIPDFRAAAERRGVAVTDIGRIVEGDGSPEFLDPAGQPLTFARPSYSHF